MKDIVFKTVEAVFNRAVDLSGIYFGGIHLEKGDKEYILDSGTVTQHIDNEGNETRVSIDIISDLDWLKENFGDSCDYDLEAEDLSDLTEQSIFVEYENCTAVEDIADENITSITMYYNHKGKEEELELTIW